MTTSVLLAAIAVSCISKQSSDRIVSRSPDGSLEMSFALFVKSL